MVELAPNVAAMVKRLERLAAHDSIRGEEIDGASVSQSLSEAAALIEKLEQGWRPAHAAECGYTGGWCIRETCIQKGICQAADALLTEGGGP